MSRWDEKHGAFISDGMHVADTSIDTDTSRIFFSPTSVGKTNQSTLMVCSGLFRDLGRSTKMQVLLLSLSVRPLCSAAAGLFLSFDPFKLSSGAPGPLRFV